MKFKVVVKHGMVTKFQPLRIQIGSIFNQNFKKEGNKDIWTYEVSFKSLNQLKHQAKGSLRLSVPIANIHNRLFSVWFAFGIKDIAHNSVVASALASSNTDMPSSSNSLPSKNSTAKLDSKGMKQLKINRDHKQDAKDDTNGYPALSNNKHQTMADIALIKYPFLPIILSFALFDSFIIAAALIIRRKIMKGNKQ